MIERSQEILIGAALMQKVLGGCPAVVGIEDNKPEAIKAMSAALDALKAKSADYAGIRIQILKKK